MVQEVVKRDGRVVPFDARKVEQAVARCMQSLGYESGQVTKAAAEVSAAVSAGIVLVRVGVERVQDLVEAALHDSGLRDAARAYMVYRDERTRQRQVVSAAVSVGVSDVGEAPAGWGEFAHRVFVERYSMDRKENWTDTARRVPDAVFSPHAHLQGVLDLRWEAERLIAERKLLPGGRYLYSAGRELHQCQNCLMTIVEDSREGWAEHVSNHTMGLSTGAGMGTVYSRLRPRGARLKRTGGVASGPVPLAVATNELGRGLRQGGDRRSALWGGLHWWHADAPAFVRLKNWAPEVRAMKAANWEFPAPMDQTNISTCLDDEFFRAYNDPNYSRSDDWHGQVSHERARRVYWDTLRNALETGDPGLSIDVGDNAGEWLRNACVVGETEILTDAGYRRIDECVGERVTVWNGYEWSQVEPRVTGQNQSVLRFGFSSGQSLTTTEGHTFWVQRAYNKPPVPVLASELKVGDKLAKFSYPVLKEGKSVSYAYSQGFISGDGMDGYKFATVYDEKATCIPRLTGRAGKHDEERKRLNFSFSFDPHSKNFVPHGWDLQSRLDWLAGLIDTDGTETDEGGCQIGSVNFAFLTETQKMLTTMGTPSKVVEMRESGVRLLPDGKGGKKAYMCQYTYRLLICSVQVQNLKALGLKCERVKFCKSPQRDASRFITVESITCAGIEEEVYCFNEPKRHLGCFNGVVTGQCTELTASEDSDICNIASVNMARIDSLEEFIVAVEVGTAFLLSGTVYSHVPYEKVARVREKFRRLGLGLMGVHEWLLKRGKAYGPDEELGRWLEVYRQSTGIAARWADAWSISRPVKTRAMAPNGTIGIVGETTTCMEPLLSVAYKRRVKRGDQTYAQHVIDPVAARLVREGVRPDDIETAYSLAETRGGIERRVAFQAWFQRYVDHGIASTINLPAWGSPVNNEDGVQWFGEMLLEYLPHLRGITVYPDGARGGQPITQVPFDEALARGGELTYETGDVCDLRGGACGS